jgi:hypothetical protein
MGTHSPIKINMNTISVASVDKYILGMTIPKTNNVTNSRPSSNAQSESIPRLVPRMWVVEFLNKPPIKEWGVRLQTQFFKQGCSSRKIPFLEKLILSTLVL